MTRHIPGISQTSQLATSIVNSSWHQIQLGNKMRNCLYVLDSNQYQNDKVVIILIENIIVPKSFGQPKRETTRLSQTCILDFRRAHFKLSSRPKKGRSMAGHPQQQANCDKGEKGGIFKETTAAQEFTEQAQEDKKRSWKRLENVQQRLITDVQTSENEGKVVLKMLETTKMFSSFHLEYKGFMDQVCYL